MGCLGGEVSPKAVRIYRNFRETLLLLRMMDRPRERCCGCCCYGSFAVLPTRSPRPKWPHVLGWCELQEQATEIWQDMSALGGREHVGQRILEGKTCDGTTAVWLGSEKSKEDKHALSHNRSSPNATQPVTPRWLFLAAIVPIQAIEQFSQKGSPRRALGIEQIWLPKSQKALGR